MRLSNQRQGLQVPKPQEKESYLSALESDVVVLEAVVVAEAVVVLEAAVVAEAVVVLEAVVLSEAVVVQDLDIGVMDSWVMGLEDSQVLDGDILTMAMAMDTHTGSLGKKFPRKVKT